MRIEIAKGATVIEVRNMSAMRFLLRYSSLGIFAFFLLGCATGRPLWTGDESLAKEKKLTSKPGIKVRAYVTHDGTEHKYSGYVQKIGSELHFSKSSHGDWTRPSEEDSMILAQSEVAWLIVDKGTPLGVAAGFLVGGCVAILITVPILAFVL